MDDSAAAALSVIVTRSRAHGHRAYVRYGDVEAGFRDLETGQVHCIEGYTSLVAGATEGMTSRPVTPRQTTRPPASPPAAYPVGVTTRVPTQVAAQPLAS